MHKPVLPYLEMMTNQSCNLACYGCTNYSDLRHSGYVTWAQGKEQISNWTGKAKTKFAKAFDEVKTTPTKLTGRINDSTILLQVF